MLNNKTVAVVIPCYNEATQIKTVLSTIPDFVDRIVVINDKSSDSTLEVIKEYAEKNNVETSLPPFQKKAKHESRFAHAENVADQLREIEDSKHVESEIIQVSPKSKITLINHLYNGGVGGGIASGYKWCRDNQIDCVAVMAGDGQMDPDELESICLPVVLDEVDYVKGNRLIHRAARQVIPIKRFFGNSVLSILTKIASGYWHVSDTQTGYTAISLTALEGICLSGIYKSYGMPNDMLVKLNIGSFTIKEVPIKPIYNVGEKSKMKITKVIPKISFLLIKLFLKRLFVKYLFNDFHPLFLCYLMFFASSLVSLTCMSIFWNEYFKWDVFNENYFLLTGLTSMFSMFFLLFGMWFDMQDNDRLQK